MDLSLNMKCILLNIAKIWSREDKYYKGEQKKKNFLKVAISFLSLFNHLLSYIKFVTTEAQGIKASLSIASILMISFVKSISLFCSWPSASLETRKHLFSGAAGADNLFSCRMHFLSYTELRWDLALIHPDFEGNEVYVSL